MAFTTAANRQDVTQLLKLVRTIPPIAGKPGRPRQRPDFLYADRGYDPAPHRRVIRLMQINPEIAHRYVGHGSGLGKYRWVVERTLSWLHQFRRLRIRWKRRVDIHDVFSTIGCILICYRFSKQ